MRIYESSINILMKRGIRAYKAMRFDNVVLGEEEFMHFSKNGNRPRFGSDNYLDMISMYEDNPNGPGFMYLLTYQNHGGYEQNEKEYDTIHIQKELGELIDDANEYLTSIEKSITVYEDLVDYYKQNGRDIVIMMIGDRAPAFISELESRSELSTEHQELAKRTVPLTGYYKAVVELHEEIPIRTNIGICMDNEGNIRKIDNDESSYNLI